MTHVVNEACIRCKYTVASMAAPRTAFAKEEIFRRRAAK
jgi:hypothetical protein